ncbi:tetratricopeptide repeat protein [Blattabacterium cuenoti]|uniref:tetratricopeptide repeat protein n=1 Tax=Blattabacterium cuenoti TaxID=1653831 RepID=UPI00163D38A2|nr:hypothetical protein [Blattabacterium cuenoti]
MIITKSKKTYLLLILFIIVIITFFSIKFFKDLSDKSINELNYAQQFLYKGMIEKALNEKNIRKDYLGLSNISYKYPFTNAGNIANFYAGICYYDLYNYEKCIDMMKKFHSKDEIMSSIKYGIIGDAYLQMNDKKKAINNYIIASTIKINEINTPLYYYKAALLYLCDNKYKESKYYLKEIENKYPSFIYIDDVEKYISFIENKILT